MKLQFKAKVRDGQVLEPSLRTTKIIQRPEFTPAHVVSGGLFNDLQFKMQMRRCENAGAKRPPRTLALDDLPENVTIDTSGFLAVVTVDMNPPKQKV